jgi:hypothetical protein
VKLARRGRDYLRSALLGTILASFLDVRAVIALCLSLLFAAAISEVILATATTGDLTVDLEEPHLSCFKDGEAIENISINIKRKRFVRVAVASVKGPDGVDTVSNDSSDSPSFTFRPRYAGRFEGLQVTFEFIDPLGLFRKSLFVSRGDFVIDCYPSSLLKDVRQTTPITLALGERSGRTHGSGQEFYSIDEYNSSIERKNIYWKKIASLPDERLLVKVREANIPNSLTIGLIKTVDREGKELEWMDLACEAAGVIGTNIFSLGCDVNLVFLFKNAVAKFEASDALEYRESLMRMSQAQTSSGENTAEILEQCDICLAGFKELEDELLAEEVARKPSVLIKDEDAYPKSLGNLSVIYTGSEDVGELVNRVIRR